MTAICGLHPTLPCNPACPAPALPVRQDTVGRLSGGLEKLIQAAVEVDAMQKELSLAKVEVERATKNCNELLEVGGRGVSVGARAFVRVCMRTRACIMYVFESV